MLYEKLKQYPRISKATFITMKKSKLYAMMEEEIKTEVLTWYSWQANYKEALDRISRV